MRTTTVALPKTDAPLVFEDYEPDVYQVVYNYTTTLNIYLQFFSIFVNIFHFFILTRKELRSIAIYIIMSAICIFDIILFSIEIYFTAVENQLIPSLFPIPYEQCLREDYTEVSAGFTLIQLAKGATRKASDWLAISIALTRTLSVLFPMSGCIQGLSKAKSAVLMLLLIFVFFVCFSGWHLLFFRILWLPDNFNEDCKARYRLATNDRYLLAAPTFIGDLLSRLGFVEAIMKLIPTLLYPMLTISLIIELRTIKKRRMNMKKKNETADNTTKIILFMTVTFMLSEGLAGILDIFFYNIEALLAYNDTFAYWILTCEYPLITLRTLNAISHAFVCYLMSSQYREVVKSMFCGRSKGSRKTVILVEETASINSQKFRLSDGWRKSKET